MWTNLALCLQQADLVVQHLVFSTLLLPHRSLFLQLRAPESLDTIHA